MSLYEYVNGYLDGSNVVLLTRAPDGTLRRRTERAEYVTYLDAKEVPADFVRDLRSSRFVRSFHQSGDWFRVGWTDRYIRDDMQFGRRGRDPRPSPFEERGIRTYEGDVHPVRRFLTDSGARIQKPRRAYFDLETDSRVPFSRKEEMRILSWALVDPDGGVRSAVLAADEDSAERDLIGEFFEAAAEFDQLLAWNGDRFDFPVLRARVERHVLRVEPDRWLWLDHLALFKRMNTASESGDEKTSMRLQDVATALLGEGKDDFDASQTWAAWEAGGEARDRLLRYNEKDTDLLRRIEEKTGSAALFDTLAEVCGVFPDSTGLQPTRQMDGYMLREGLERGVHFPTKKFREDAGTKYAGAYVMEPRTSGIETDVHVCDFASLYPSIILTWNMSPETKVDVLINGPVADGTCRAPSTRQGFRTTSRGILPDALRKLLDMRKDWNAKKAALPPGTPEWADADRRSTAYKVVANSFYGVVGSPFSRFFDRRIAESVTKNGEWLLKLTIEAARRRGMTAIYGDTDSVFVKEASRTEFEEFVRWCNAELFPAEIAATGATENFVKLAYEKQFRRIVFTGAKRYAGQYAHYKGTEAAVDSKPEVKGLEYKRGDTALLARRLQERVIQRLVVDGDLRIETYREILGEALRRVLHEPLPVEEVRISKAITKPLREYVSKKKADGTDAALPAHVRVAKQLEARGAEVGEGTRIAYVVLDGDGGLNAVAPADDYDGTTFDRYYLWEALVYPPTQRLLEAAFPDADWKAGLERVRPPKPRGKSRKAAEGQLGLGLSTTAPTVAGLEPFAFGIREDFGSEAELRKLRAVAEKHPGGREFVLHICLDSGAVAVLPTSIRVSGSPALLRDLEDLLWASAASREWEARCAS